MKNQKGITLIALVITIIVLLILAGVSIAMLAGPNGILTQANDASDANKKAEAADRINLALNACYSKILQGKTPVAADKVDVPTADFTVTESGDAAGTDYSITITSKTYTAVTGKIVYDTTAKQYALTAATATK